MLWLAQFVSNIGTFMRGIGVVWVVLELRQSPAVVALVQTAVALPVLLLGYPRGALADLIDRRRLMLAAAATLLALSFTRSPLLAALITFVAGAGWLLCLAVFSVAAQQVLPDLVPARGLALNLTVTARAAAVGSAAWGAVANALGVPGPSPGKPRGRCNAPGRRALAGQAGS